ncbi:MAG: molybdopterin-binding protein, partial [Lachnospiraceae bacterium]
MIWNTAIITLSDKGYKGEREDKSGPLIKQMLLDSSYQVCEEILLPDEKQMIEKELYRLCDQEHMALILTTGGTGFSPRDCTPEAT